MSKIVPNKQHHNRHQQPTLVEDDDIPAPTVTTTLSVDAAERPSDTNERALPKKMIPEVTNHKMNSKHEEDKMKKPLPTFSIPTKKKNKRQVAAVAPDDNIGLTQNMHSQEIQTSPTSVAAFHSNVNSSDIQQDNRDKPPRERYNNSDSNKERRRTIHNHDILGKINKDDENNNDNNDNHNNMKSKSRSLIVESASTAASGEENDSTEGKAIAQLSPQERDAQQDFVSHACYTSTTQKRKLPTAPHTIRSSASGTSVANSSNCGDTHSFFGDSSTDTMITANTTSKKCTIFKPSPTTCSLPCLPSSKSTAVPAILDNNLEDPVRSAYYNDGSSYCDGDDDGGSKNMTTVSAPVKRSSEILVNVDGVASTTTSPIKLQEQKPLSIMLQEQQLEYYRSQRNMATLPNNTNTNTNTHATETEVATTTASTSPIAARSDVIVMDPLDLATIISNDHVGITRTTRHKPHSRILHIMEAVILLLVVVLAVAVTFLILNNNNDKDDSTSSSSYDQYQIGSDILGGLTTYGDQKTGKAVAISKDGRIVAVAGEGNIQDKNSGRVRIFEFHESIRVDSKDTSTITTNNNTNDIADRVRFSADDGDWVQLGQSIDGTNPDDWLGASIDLSSDGHIIAIGVPKHNHATGYVTILEYKYDSNAWKLLGSNNITDNADFGDWSGASVSLSSNGHIVAIGSPFHSRWFQQQQGERQYQTKTRNVGQVRVYKYTIESNSWNQVGQTMNGNHDNCFFGYAVSLSNTGERLAIGGSRCSTNDANHKSITPKDDNGNASSHVVTILQNVDDPQWNIIAVIGNEELEMNNIPAKNNYFGSISLSGDGTTVAYGNPHNDHDTNVDGDPLYDTGSVHVFGRPHDPQVSDHVTPHSRNSHNEYTATKKQITRDQNDDYDTAQFLPLGSILWGKSSKDFFGMDVSLSDDGTTLLVGSPGHDSTTNPDLGSSSAPSNLIMSGSAYLYDIHARSNIWTSATTQRIRRQLQNDNDDNGFRGVDTSDQFGRSVAMSGDGTCFIVGAPFHTNSKDEVWGGHVRVFQHPLA